MFGHQDHHQDDTPDDVHVPDELTNGASEASAGSGILGASPHPPLMDHAPSAPEPAGTPDMPSPLPTAAGSPVGSDYQSLMAPAASDDTASAGDLTAAPSSTPTVSD